VHTTPNKHSQSPMPGSEREEAAPLLPAAAGQTWVYGSGDQRKRVDETICVRFSHHRK
jgi:hypothetical protein